GQWAVVGEPSPSAFANDGIVPVVPFVRRMSTDDHDGTSVAADIIDLTDAENKLMQDAMVTSESYARPRRWATGLRFRKMTTEIPLTRSAVTGPYSRRTQKLGSANSIPRAWTPTGICPQRSRR